MENFISMLSAAAITGLMVGGIAYLTLARCFKAEENRREAESLPASKRITLPMRLQAYERLIIFLERISPDGMLIRLKAQMQTNSDLHLIMLQTIRAEYEHNISQQLYVGFDTWEKVKQAKESVVSFINDCAKGIDPSKSSIELSKSIFDALIEKGESPVAQALDDLKREAQRYL